MSYASEELSDRIRDHFANLHGMTEKKMFGGRAFMLNGNMIVGVMKDGTLLARVGKDNHIAALERPGCSEMTMGEKSMTGFVSVDGDVIEDEETLAGWLDECLAFAASLPPK